MPGYVLALDEGTTSARAILFDKKGKIVACAQKEFRMIYPRPGWVEQDPMEVYAAQYGVMTEAVAQSGVAPEEIAAVGITNQRETTVVWDKKTGKPVYHAIVWQCRRTADACRRLKEQGLEERITALTGLRPDAYFSATKLRWILDHVENGQQRAENGELLFGTVDSWLLWKLTGGAVHATDVTNASRTMLWNIRSCCWDEELLHLFGIPACMMPRVQASGSCFGTVQLLNASVPVCGIAGDQQAALFGQGCFRAGEAKNTYGTGCFLLMHTGEEPFFSGNGLVTTAAAMLEGEKPCYALEGSVFVGGAVIQWLRDELGLIREASDSEYFARKVKDNGGVYLVPAFTGLGAPYWNMEARGVLTGLTRGCGRNHIIRAALEAVAYQTDDLLRAMRLDTGRDISALKADGGAAANGFLMQFQADVSNVRVICGESGEATALGAAFLAGLTAGLWKSREELPLFESGRTYLPRMEQEERTTLRAGWEKAVRKAEEI